jgi:hypothetical protein
MEEQKIVSSPSQNPDKLPLIGDFWEEGFKFIGAHWKKLLLYFVPLALLQVVIGYLNFHFFGAQELPPVWASIVAVVIGIAISYVMMCSSDLFCRELDNGGDTNPLNIYARGFRYFWKMLWAGILVMLVISAGIALAYAGGMAFFAIGGLLSALIGKGILSVLITALLGFIGVVFIFFCYIYFALSAIFVTYTVMLEEKKGMNALIQSFWYVKGRRWGIFGRMFVVGLIPGFIAVIGGVIGMAIIVSKFTFKGLEGLSDPTSDVYVAFFTFSMIMNLIFVPLSHLFYSSFGYVLWKQAKLTAGSEDVQGAYRTSKRGKFVAAAWVGFALGILVAAFAVLAPVFLENWTDKLGTKNTRSSENGVEEVGSFESME